MVSTRKTKRTDKSEEGQESGVAAENDAPPSPPPKKSRDDSVKENEPEIVKEVEGTTPATTVKEIKKEPDAETKNNPEGSGAENVQASTKEVASDEVPTVKAEVKKEEYDSDEEGPMGRLKRQESHSSRTCPYLDTINRGVLDFDFEKLCSVSLSHMNVYACLVCGKYFQGRGQNTHAYTHSVDTDHRVYLNLMTLRFYCLPDNYEIIDSSLGDIKYVLRPTYEVKQIAESQNSSKLHRAYDDTTYHPGVIGLNNIKANDYCNVVLHALFTVTPLRNYFMREENYSNIKRAPGDKLEILYRRFGELIRKLWNPRAFKAHVSPHEMLQAVVLCSQKRFQITQQGDAVEFLSWLLNSLHISLNGTKKNSSSIIYNTFRGKMRAYSKKVLPVDVSEAEARRLLSSEEYAETDQEVPFLYLTLDLPQAPLYRDEQLQNIIPQVPLNVLLQKFNGSMEKEYKTYNANIMKRFEITRLPPFLILYIKRFTKNTWFVEKNPTIVNFPIKNVDLFEYLSDDAKLEHKFTTYDLLANIVHDGKPPGNEDAVKRKRRKKNIKNDEENKEDGSYRVQIRHKGTNKWFEMQDLHVKEILPQMITLTESYIQVWELNTSKTREDRKGESVDNDLVGGDNASSSTAATPMDAS